MQLLRKKFSKFLILRFCRIFVKMVISKEFKGGKLRNPKIKLKRTHTNIDKSERRISQEQNEQINKDLEKNPKTTDMLKAEDRATM